MFTVLETTYLKETKTKTSNSVVTLTDMSVAPVVQPVTVTSTQQVVVTAEANQGSLKTAYRTRTRTLMHFGQNLVKNTVSRTTTVTDKYQVLQMGTTIQTVTVPLDHTVTVSNTQFLPSFAPAPVIQQTYRPVPQINIPQFAQQGTY